LWAASTAGNLGDGIGRVAVALLAARLTRDPVAVAAVTALSYLPWLVFGLLAGVLVDRYDRRHLAVATGAVRASAIAVLAVVAATDRASLLLLYGVVLVLYTCETVYDNAVSSMVPMVVADREDLESANGRLQGSRLIAESFLGPPLAGMVFVLAAGYAFSATATCYAAATLLLLGLRGRFTAGAAAGTGPSPRPAAGSSMRRDAAEGVRYLREHALHRRLLGVMLGLGFGAAMVNATMVLWAQDVLHVPEALYGVFGLTLAAGALAGSQSAAALARRLGRGRTLRLAVAGCAAGALLAAATTSPYVAGAGLAVVGCASLVFNVVNASLRQRLTPSALLGRVVGVYLAATVGVMVVGSVAGGALAAAGGLRLPWLLCGIGLLATTTWIVRGLDERAIAAAVAEADAAHRGEEPAVAGPRGDEGESAA
jgi:MFS family permease